MSRKLSRTQLSLVLMGVGVLLLLGGGSALADGWRALRLALSGFSNWEPVQATVIQADVDRSTRSRGTDGPGARSEDVYQLRVTYRYAYEDMEHVSDRYSLIESASSDEVAVRTRLKDFAPGSTITVYVNPEKPEEAVVVRDDVEAPAVMAGLGFLFAVGGLGFVTAGAVVALKRRRSSA